MEDMDKAGTYSTNMGVNKLAENAPKIVGPIFLPKPKSLGFSKKNSLGIRSLC